MTEVEFIRLRPRCVYASGSRVDGVYVIPLPCETERYLVIWHGEYYTFGFKEDVMKFLERRLGGGTVEIRPC